MKHYAATGVYPVEAQSTAMQSVWDFLHVGAQAKSTILLLGESGTGKEVAAHAVHQWSQRAPRPFVVVNCAALHPALVESDLFGHENGAFTGAMAQRKGKFEIAHGGTLFLDEIGELASHLQGKLLRALEIREIERVGGTHPIGVDVRIVAATNRNLGEAMDAGVFRKDLYYRLNVISATLPPLRERREDIPALIDHFLQLLCHEVNRPKLSVEDAAMDLLRSYYWPGNVRELQNVMERCTILCAGPTIRIADLPSEILTSRSFKEGMYA